MASEPIKAAALTLCLALVALAEPMKTLTPADWAVIRAERLRHRHDVLPDGQGFLARNPGQRWVARFDGRGFEVTPGRASWRWGLTLESYGFKGAERRVIRSQSAAAGARFSYRWDDRLTEWYINGERGLEHGFTLAHRPAGAGPLVFHLAVRGTLEPRVADGGRLVTFTAKRAPVVNYAGLKVTDARGRELAARFYTAGASLRLEIDETGAAYPITVDPIAQQAYLKPAAVGTIQQGDGFGYSVAVSGDTVVVGAPYEDSSSTGVNSTADETSVDSGAAYVFTRTGGVWTQQAYLKPGAFGTAMTNDYFGYAVAISGDTIAVGVSSEDSSTFGVNSTPNENGPGSGAVFIFTRTAGVWSQQAYIKSPSGSLRQSGFGEAVALSGDTLVVGSPGEASSSTGVNSTPVSNAAGAGAAFVYTRSGTAWSSQAYLKPAAVGSTQVSDSFGFAVAISGDTVVVGAPEESSSTTGVNSVANEDAAGSGAAYVFVRSAGVWTQQAYLKPAAIGSTQASDSFGYAVGVSGDTVVVGAPEEDSSTTGVNGSPNESATDSGAAYVFTRTAGLWSQQAYLKPAAVGTATAFDYFGYGAAISGDTIVVGAIYEGSSATGVNGTPDETAPSSGAAIVFTRSAGVWSEHAYLKPAAVGTTQSDDRFATAVAVTDGLIVVGASKEDSSTTGVNTAANESASNSGAAYTFSIPASETTPLFTITRSAPVLNRATGRFSQKVTLVNNGDALTSAAMVFDYLPAGVSVYQPSGTTADTSPAGNPYRELGPIAAGATVTVTVEFTRAGAQAITYTPRLLGPGSR